jgi:hypothetical protein
VHPHPSCSRNLAGNIGSLRLKELGGIVWPPLWAEGGMASRGDEEAIGSDHERGVMMNPLQQRPYLLEPHSPQITRIRRPTHLFSIEKTSDREQVLRATDKKSFRTELNRRSPCASVFCVAA